ncbi:Bcr/CflA family efflux MFS transporter [Paracraurococcus ruber]|uniref:Bcr/CflA family efflux transporter n=2 Tax=Paracraurococcus ruber TaxID=77675 RepID=A0ABS1CU35_9PROT|nr:Bcr/CflA family drug resistance efflux transporter [Paracraurococcus ruber]TDG33806.1 Bcr/CflA family efflux MFS transporter [Paracraurococcus ruber]
MSPRDIPEGASAPPLQAMPPPRPKPSILLLVAMTGLGPFTMQMLIPSLPALAIALAVPYATIQLTLTLFLVGVAVGQLFYGPLSDRFGRKPLLIGGLVIYLAGSLAAALAPSAGFLIAARIAQALGGCAGLVLGRAMIRDSYPREQAAAVLGYVSTAMAVAPMLSPLIGALLQEHVGWRASMLSCLVFGLPLLLAVRARLPETLAQPAPLPGLGGMIGAYRTLLRIPLFRGYCVITACATSMFFAFAAGGPMVVVQGLGHSATTYAVAMMAISVGWSSGTFTAARLVQRLGTARMLRIGTVVTTAGGLLALAMPALAAPTLLLFFLPMAVVALGNGMTQPSAIAAAISVRPQLAGTASGLLGSLQMGAGALATVLAGVTESGAGLATGAWMLAGALGAQAGLMLVRRHGG